MLRCTVIPSQTWLFPVPRSLATGTRVLDAPSHGHPEPRHSFSTHRLRHFRWFNFLLDRRVYLYPARERDPPEGWKKFEMATFDEYFGPTRMMCRVVGIWPLEMEAPLAKRILHWTANILMMLGLLNFILPQALLIVDSMGNFSTIMPVCAIMAVTMLLGWKQLYFTLYHAKLGHIFSELKDIWYEVDAVPEQRKIYNGYARNCRLLTIGLLMSTIINNTLSTATAIVDWWKFNRGTREPGLVRHLPYELR